MTKYSDQLKADDNSAGESYKTLGESCHDSKVKYESTRCHCLNSEQWPRTAVSNHISDTLPFCKRVSPCHSAA